MTARPGYRYEWIIQEPVHRAARAAGDSYSSGDFGRLAFLDAKGMIHMIPFNVALLMFHTLGHYICNTTDRNAL